MRTHDVPRTDARNPRTILVIESDGYCRFFFDEVLRQGDLSIVIAADTVSGSRMLGERDFDAVMVNLPTFSQSQLASVSILAQGNCRVPVIAVSERFEVDFAVEVIRSGAFDYLTKPFNNIARLESSLREAFAKRDRAREAAHLNQEEVQSHGLMGSSKPLRELLEVINQIASLNVSVLITGESGTGKELVARAIHVRSNRSSGPFFAVNCGALPEGLVESMLFGHEKGAFTGAVTASPGFLEKSRGGTLFLDEVGELSPKAQVTLLRFLEEREFLRVGGTKTLHSDARIIASTNRDLEREVAEHRFRADVHFRLNVVHLKVPPLRKRKDDIINLARYFMKKFSLSNAVPVRTLSPEAARVLERYDWPGNVRELENLMEGLMAILPSSTQTISDRDIFAYSDKIRRFAGESGSEQSISSLANLTHREAVEQFETTYLRAVLDAHDGNVTRAAKAADIHPVTFHRKLRKLKAVRLGRGDIHRG